MIKEHFFQKRMSNINEIIITFRSHDIQCLSIE